MMMDTTDSNDTRGKTLYCESTIVPGPHGMHPPPTQHPARDDTLFAFTFWH